MAFVCVVDGVVDAELLESITPPMPRRYSCFDTVLPVTAVELVGDRTVPFAVHVEVRVEKIELHAAYVHTPDVAVDDTAGDMVTSRIIGWPLPSVICLMGSWLKF